VLKFRVWNTKEKKYFEHFKGARVDLALTYYERTTHTLYPEQYTGLKDKNGVDGYFDSDVWEIKDYEYSIQYGSGRNRGFTNHKCDLRFILKHHPLVIEYELINPPKGLDGISLNTIFNLETKRTGKRIFVDNDRQKLEIIGNIRQNPELLTEN
jgi:uncharacterized phage protein (TIGR01671 family)